MSLVNTSGASWRVHALQNIARAGALIVFVLFTPHQAFAATNDEIEAKVRAFFADVPVMVDIARCESRFRQFTENGNPLYGGYAGKMVGIFQVYKDIHAKAAKAMELDIETPEGNMSYARYLYEKQGTDPWLSSSRCWGASVAEAADEPMPQSMNTNTAVSVRDEKLTKDLKLGTIDPEVLVLQQILNQNGFALVDEGLGSAGYETEKFGALTRDAVRRFQCEKNIVCKGDEKTTGYGMVGARTRIALNALPIDPTKFPLSVSHESISAASVLSTTTGTTTDTSTQLSTLHNQLTELFKVVTTLQPQQ